MARFPGLGVFEIIFYRFRLILADSSELIWKKSKKKLLIIEAQRWCRNNQHNDIQHNEPLQVDTQHNATQHNDNLHNDNQQMTLTIMTLSIMLFSTMTICIISK